MEAKFDKQCFLPLSELYITGTMGIGFPARYTGVKNQCTGQLAPILAAAAKLDANAATATQGKCSERLGREGAAECNAKARKSYYDCAAVALKQGKDDASQCLAIRQLGRDILQQVGNGPKPKPADPPSRKP
jgi:hypothetical protein